MLVTAGPVFTEEMWRLACCALQDAFSATLKPVKVKCSQREPGQVPVFHGPWCLSHGAAGCHPPLSRQSYLNSDPGGERSCQISAVVPDAGTMAAPGCTRMQPGNICCVSPQDLLGCFHSGTESFSGEGCQVRVAAPSSSPSAEAEYWRIRAMAQQVRTGDF